MGASAVFLYVSCNEESTSETHEPVGGTAKVAIHEKIHTMQVQMLRGQLTSLTPDNDTLGVNRFQVKNFTCFFLGWRRRLNNTSRFTFLQF